jgi:hypothetical protein
VVGPIVTSGAAGSGVEGAAAGSLDVGDAAPAIRPRPRSPHKQMIASNAQTKPILFAARRPLDMCVSFTWPNRALGPSSLSTTLYRRAAVS